MSSLKDDFARGFVNLMREEGAKYNPESIVIGIVSSVNPLQVAIGESALDIDDLYIDNRLLGYTEFAELNYTQDYDLVHREVQIKHKSVINSDSKLLLYRIGDKYAVLGVI